MGLDSGTGDEGSLAVRLNQNNAKAAVAFGRALVDDADALAEQFRADTLAIGPGAVAAGEDAAEALARRGAQDVEASPCRDAAGRGENVAAPGGKMGELKTNVGDDAADGEKSRRPPEVHHPVPFERRASSASASGLSLSSGLAA
jgi:hypothetical protein